MAGYDDLNPPPKSWRISQETPHAMAMVAGSITRTIVVNVAGSRRFVWSMICEGMEQLAMDAVPWANISDGKPFGRFASPSISDKNVGKGRYGLLHGVVLAAKGGIGQLQMLHPREGGGF